MTNNGRVMLVTMLAMSLAISGCERDDERAVQLAREAAERQAAQNQQMAKLQEHVAKGSEQLVENSTASHRELAKLQRALREDQAEVAAQRDVLEAERKELAAHRVRDPIVGNALLIVGLCIVALAPLALAAYALKVADASKDDSLIASTLIEDLASESPRICIAGPPVRAARALPWDPLESTCRHASLSIL